MPGAVRQMGEVRHAEGVAAAETLGVDPNQLAFLGYPDFGTLTIWYEHWGNRPPLESMLTRVTKVPYANAFRPGASYKGEDILNDIEENLREFKPTKVFVSHPSDHNVDHQALYLFTRVALWDLENEMCPELYPYLVHFEHWPSPQGLLKGRPILPPEPLAGIIDWGVVPLSPGQVNGKELALRAHRSQLDYSKNYLNSFVRANELFGDFAPVVASVLQTNNEVLTGRRHQFSLFQQQLNTRSARILSASRRCPSPGKTMTWWRQCGYRNICSAASRHQFSCSVIVTTSHLHRCRSCASTSVRFGMTSSIRTANCRRIPCRFIAGDRN